MSKEKIWLASPHMGGAELDYIRKAFNENWIAPLGPNVDGFEADLVTFTGTEHAAALSSGTAAIHLAMVLLGVEAGDEIICQSMTFAATANPIIYQGASPVFVDSEPETWNIDPGLLKETIEDRIDKKGKKPKAIIPVHLYGMPAKMPEIMTVAQKYDIPVIEDAAEALGSSISGQKAGSFGDIGILSFNGNKIITTSGGGALLSDNKEFIEKARFLATQARDDAPHYQHSEIGYNYRMSNILAGVGRGQMQVLEKRITQKRAIFDQYFEALGATWLRISIQHSNFNIQHSTPTGIYFLKEPQDYFSNRWLTTIVINPEETGGVTREDIRIALHKENIDARPLWKPMHMQPIYKDAPFYENGISEWLFENGLCLPSGTNLSEKDLHKIIKTVNLLID
jgi:dTDP-4-amino-4,6-dideoxygalactose transaminase